MEKITDYVCPVCGSNDVVRDAWAVWNVTTQEFELSSLFDNWMCNECARDGSPNPIIAREVSYSKHDKTK